ncbi:kinase-like domain-containing protein [Pisolithus microcarpus]|nr:kinase-like domain-containing protein [Pisolithus microcarpus]
MHHRPLGPRTPRSQSPHLAETRPLQIRKASVDQSFLRPPSPASQLSSSPTPSRPLIPGSTPSSRTNGLQLKLQLPLSGGVGSISDYYAGPASIPPGLGGENPNGATVRPSDMQLQTPRPAEQRDSSDSSIEQLVSVFKKASVDSNASAEEISTYGSTMWSDSVLEEICRLGEGQGGAVHKVRDIRNGFILARKTITTREAPLKQLGRELQISSTSKHINIIRFYGAYMSPSSSEVKVMMEYCAGGSLEAVSKRIRERGGRVSERVAGRIAQGTSNHPNILLTEQGVVRLIDFGVSGELVKSLAGTFTGTSFYMAPERISGKEYSIRADVWSTGITLLELVQNRYPFPDDLTSIELLVHITQGDPPQLTDEPDLKWSDEMKDFIRQTLIVDHTARPTPEETLAHPWIASVMRKEVPMAKWISEVWGWHRNRSSSSDASRPSSSRGLPFPTPP